VLLVAVLPTACSDAPAAEPPAEELTTTTAKIDIGEPAVLDRDDPTFTRDD
jgi:hypothetical protein